jgi:hypothetical protein
VANTTDPARALDDLDEAAPIVVDSNGVWSALITETHARAARLAGDLGFNRPCAAARA